MVKLDQAQIWPLQAHLLTLPISSELLVIACEDPQVVPVSSLQFLSTLFYELKMCQRHFRNERVGAIIPPWISCSALCSPSTVTD